MSRILLVFFAIASTLVHIVAQKSFQPKQVDNEWKGIIYRNEKTGNATLHTNGYTIAYNSGKIKTYYKTNYYHLELGYMTDPREQKQNRNIPLSFNKVSQAFKFGKQNYLYVLRAGKGTKRLITDKAKRKGVAVGYNYEAGPSIAFLRPYYLELIYNIEQDGRFYNELRVEKYSEDNAVKFLDYNSVFGGAPGNKGWSELSIVPGVQGKLGLFFSLGAFEEYARSLEIGLMGDFFIKKIPVMVETDAISSKPYFLNFYATIEFGKRTN
ncbi:MAG: hypothetical protein IPL08_15740 [Saprospiraceae bacterium]|nr:hypothetical protein [Saprospiraceae bacterium]MBK8668460.1 hypothetical protein [Saprospiraceae bacterium]MBL0098786.1 hypothetical protein [Saprospiraceae bacterium]